MQVVAAVDVGMIVAVLLVLLFVGSIVFNTVDRRRNKGVSPASQKAIEGLNSAGQDAHAQSYGNDGNGG